MYHVTEMLNTHPQTQDISVDMLAACIQECFDCAQVCTICADACLSEGNVEELRTCIRANLDCADVCEATGRILGRQTQPDPRVVQAQLDACLEALRVCAEICEVHASHHEHCRVCAESCRRCEESCHGFLRSTPGTRAESVPREVTAH